MGADRDDAGVELRFDGLDVADEVGADDDRGGPAVADDVRHLRRRQPPVHRHADRAELGQAEHRDEELGAVAVDERHPFTGSDAGRGERLRGPAGQRVEVAEGEGAVVDDQGRGVGALAAVHPDHIGDAADHGQSLGCMRCRFIRVSTAAGAMLLIACAVTAMRGAMLTGRCRAAVMIQPAASAADSPGSPS